jgi:hypothetical protein
MRAKLVRAEAEFVGFRSLFILAKCDNDEGARGDKATR